MRASLLDASRWTRSVVAVATFGVCLGACWVEGTGSSNERAVVRDADALARAAVVIGSCIPDDGINRAAADLWNSDGPRLWHAFSYVAGCLASAGSGCDALRSCLGWSRAPTSAVTCNGCSGSVATRCNEGTELRIDCGKLGLRCDQVAICSSEPASGCDSATFTPGCTSDGRPEFCDDGAVFHGPRCADLGLECDAGGVCTGTGAACQNQSSPSAANVSWDGIGCVGDTLDACVGGKRATRDCSKVGPGMGCQTFEGAHFCGLESSCLPGEELRGWQEGSRVRCDAATVTLCNAGKIDRVDCTALGFAGCDSQSNTCVPYL